MRWDSLRCFPEWALSTHFTDKESEAQRGEETAACNFSTASQLLSKMGDKGKLGWLREGDRDALDYQEVTGKVGTGTVGTLGRGTAGLPPKCQPCCYP